MRCFTPPSNSLARARNGLRMRADTTHRGEDALVRLHGSARMDGEVLQLTRSVDTVILGSANAGGGVESQVGFRLAATRANPNPNPYPNPNPNPNPNPKPNPNTDPNQVGFVSLLREHFVRLPTRSFVLDCSLRMGGPRDSGAPEP